MKYKLNLTKVFVLAGIVFALSLINPQKTLAACTSFNFSGPSANYPAESCIFGGVSSFGVAVYNCGTYQTDPGVWEQACFWHNYQCDGSCSGSGPPSGGGGGSCARPTVNCAPGYVRGTVRQTMYTCAGSRPTGCPALGSAQRYETGLNSSGNPNYGCGNCYWDEDDNFISCDWYRVGVYNCVSTTPTCSVDVLPQTIAAGSGVLFPASIPTSSGVITQVDFVSSNPTVATVTTPDTSASYSTTATGLSAGTTNITANVVMSGSVRCTDTATLTVTNTTAWWQVRDGDVTAGNGDILSNVPTGQLFNTNGLGGFPGVPVYSGSLSTAPGSISSTNWNADTTTTQGRIFDYNEINLLVS